MAAGPTPPVLARPFRQQVQPVVGESVESFLVRRALHTSTALSDLYSHLEIGKVANRDIDRLGTAQRPDLGALVATRLGIAPDLFRHMSMRRYEGRGIAFTKDGNIVLRRHWAFGTGTRFCVDCLEESGGAFQLSWRLSWTFLCLRHRTLLHDACPACGQRLVVPRGKVRRSVDPLRCQTRLPFEVNPTGLCSYRLLGSWREEPLSPRSPIIATQSFINDVLSSDGQVSILADLRAIMIAASHANLAAEVAGAAREEPGTLVGLGERAVHVGADAPDDSLTMGSLASLAVQVLSHHDRETEELIRHICFSYRDGSPPEFNSRSQGSALEILSRFPGASFSLRRRILRSVDRDLSTLHRLVHQTPLRPGRELHGKQIAAYPASAHLPEQIWSNWTQPLDYGGDYTSAALRTALIAGVAFVSRYASVEHAPTAAKGWLRRQLRNNLLGGAKATTHTLSQICELANMLQRTTALVRYELRPGLDWDNFLDWREWTEIAERAGFHSGGDTRHKLVRRYMYSRLTGADDSAAPREWLNLGKPDRTSTFTTFSMTITSGVLAMLDDYAQAFLLLHGLSEPVVWSPPRDDLAHLPIAGRELADIDLPALHEILSRPGRKPSLEYLATQVHRSATHVRLAIDEWPLPGGATEQIEWYPRLFRDLESRREEERVKFLRQHGQPPAPET
ncbi:TniQ protein [Frondihabitans sp. PhB188]|uniref:TniQ family protein n=1 Tax=Frondihabitans sp. PhB188 TaxID=2485200 RepID=UPI000F4A5385|nr:TniQ family protein [Frondihabitans sp. PhB188]ROQ37057.1 TniQ protein [Frondihabitans sp. PhB188]